MRWTTLFIRMQIADVSDLTVFGGCFCTSTNTHKRDPYFILFTGFLKGKMCTVSGWMVQTGCVGTAVFFEWCLLHGWVHAGRRCLGCFGRFHPLASAISELVRQLHYAVPVSSSSLFRIDTSPFHFPGIYTYPFTFSLLITLFTLPSRAVRSLLNLPASLNLHFNRGTFFFFFFLLKPLNMAIVDKT